MGKATYWQRGESLDYTNSDTTVLEAGTIVALGSRVGVIGTNIQPGETGSIHMEGVYEMPKSDDAAIAAGTAVYFDGSGITASSSSGSGDDETDNTVAGYCAVASPATSDTVLVKLLG